MKPTTQKRRRKIIRSSPRSLLAYDLADHDDNMKYLIGWPGYRTSNSKSGLGYIRNTSRMGAYAGTHVALDDHRQIQNL